LDGLKQRNLTDIVNVMIVSDHGMSETDVSRLIYYDDVLTADEMSLIWRIEAQPTLGIRVHPSENEDEAVEILYQAFKRLQRTLKNPHFHVYKRQDFPSRFHFQDNDARIPPLLVLPDAGWNFVTRREFDPSRQEVYRPRGVHGYDNLNAESRAIFVAQGPDFPKSKVVLPFWNVELYNVMSRILHLKPTNNNNTLNGLLQLEQE
jgi:predicted AlkP superfamily pyrophosphatase or phosphodiesterase